ncbi:hypothetical protein BJX64DRAFT_252147 [Aspergillus heterothallicus]
MASLIIFYGLLPNLVAAQNDTAANQTLERVGWTSSPDVRGTSDILWSCGAIFLVCTWKCMHFNLPSHEESEAGWHTFWGWLPYWPTRLRWKVILRQASWMCIIAIAPELGISMAADEFWQAWKLRRKVDSPGFTLTHAFYALMGGFVIAVPAEKDDKAESSEAQASSDALERASKPPPPYPENLEYFSVQSRAPERADDGSEDGDEDDTERYELVDSLAVFTIFPSITRDTRSSMLFPRVAEEDIVNQTKSDPLTKTFAILQCAWLVIQSIARTSQGLPLTELELTTLAFTACAFIMYALWWCKPFDVKRPIVLLCLNSETSAQIQSKLQPWTVSMRVSHIDQLYNFLLGIAYDFIGQELSLDSPRSVIFHTSAIIFSAIHVIAWDWDFPSPIVRTLWRSFAVGATCTPIFSVLLATLLALLRNNLDHDQESGIELIFDVFLATSIVGGIIIYVACRMGIIVLIFYCFSSMPVSVYQAPSWHSVFPHFS